MRQYFTYRLHPTANGWYTPDRIMEKCFVGMDFTYQLEIVTNNEIDGRRLGWVESDDVDKIDALLEMLQMFGIHKKTVESAQAFIKYLVNIDVTIDNEKIVFPKPSI